MTTEIALLGLTAATLGFVHTILGPDHYLPFIVMSKARKWSLGKTALITVLCGAGHVLSSVILGLAGVAFGIAVMKLKVIEDFRGNMAGWLLIGFVRFDRAERYIHAAAGAVVLACGLAIQFLGL